jgi:hypothetical protein
MIVLNILRQDRNIKKFLVDSTAHTIFYGIIGSIVALSLGVKIEIYIAMSILGTIIQFISGGFFGKFLDFIRDLAKV